MARKKPRSSKRRARSKGRSTQTSGGFDPFALSDDPEVLMVTDGTRTSVIYPDLFPQTLEALYHQGFHTMTAQDTQMLLSRMDDTDERIDPIEQMFDPSKPGMFGEQYSPQLADARRTPFEALGTGIGHYIFKPEGLESHPEQLLCTTTKEPLKPMRLLYALRKPASAHRALIKQPYIDVDPKGGRLVWLSDCLPPSAGLPQCPPGTVLASLVLQGSVMWCQTNSSLRTLAFMRVFSSRLRRHGRLVYGLDSDRFFTPQELAQTDVDQLFERAKVTSPQFLMEQLPIGPTMMDIAPIMRFKHEHPYLYEPLP